MTTRGRRGVISGLLLAVALGLSSGCFQTWLGGNTLPSADYLKDNPDYIPPGPSFPLQRELAAQQAASRSLGSVNAQPGANP